LALANILDGMNRTEAAKAAGMDRQTLRDWVHRYNNEGLEGLYDREGCGRKPYLTDEQFSSLKEIVLAGPNREKTGLSRWRSVDLQGIIEEKWGVKYHKKSIDRLLSKLGFSYISARPQHTNYDAEAQEDFKKTSKKS
jgi:transposase